MAIQNYMTNDGRVTRSSTPRPERFTWGKVLRVHQIGDDYAIVEYVPNQASNVRDEDYDPSPHFAVFVRGAHGFNWDTHCSCRTLDRALITAIAWRAEQRHFGLNQAANSQAVQYISLMLGLDD